MSYKLLVTLTFSEPGSKEFAMNTKVIDFDSKAESNTTYDSITYSYPNNAIYATVVKLYDTY